MSNVTTTRTQRRKLENLSTEQLATIGYGVFNQNESAHIVVSALDIVKMLEAGKSRTPKSKNYNAEKGSIQEELTALMIAKTGNATDFVRGSAIDKLFDKDALVGRKTHSSEPKVKGTGIAGGRKSKGILDIDLSVVTPVETVAVAVTPFETVIEETVEAVTEETAVDSLWD